MAQSLTPETVGSILASVVVLAVGGGMAYLFLVTSSVPAQSPQTQDFGVSVIESELNRTDETNVFLKTNLLQKPAAPEDAITYQQNELGKTNLSQLGQ